jgi:plastocyanin
MTRGTALAVALLAAGLFPAQGRAATVHVDISGNAYDPSPLTVAVGTTVRWTNSDPVAHTVTSSTGAFTGSGQLNQGQFFEHTFGTSGTYNYYCTLHGIGMSGTVHVVEPGPVAVAQASPPDALVGEQVEFDGSGSFGPLGADIVAWDWDFDDGETASGEVVTHAFAAAGTYDVVLTVTDADDLTDSTVIAVQVGVVAASPPPAPPPTSPTPLPALTISNAKVKEGNRGTKAMTFLVRLSAPNSQPVTVQFKTQKGTAKPKVDFVGRSGTLTIGPGQTVLKLVVKIKGDLRKEKLEKFKVLLANAVGATILDAEGAGTIRDND